MEDREVRNEAPERASFLMEKNESVAELPEKPVHRFHFRRLMAMDLPLMLRIISRLGLDNIARAITGETAAESIKNLLDSQEAEDKDSEEYRKMQSNQQLLAGINIVAACSSILLENLSNCEKEINTLLAAVTETDLETVRHMEFDTYMEMLCAFFKKEEFQNFFSHALKLAGK